MRSSAQAKPSRAPPGPNSESHGKGFFWKRTNEPQVLRCQLTWRVHIRRKTFREETMLNFTFREMSLPLA
eukprot:1923894-Pleurochrysis_carterae.AAC.4